MRHDGGNALKSQDHHEGLRTLPLNPVEWGNVRYSESTNTITFGGSGGERTALTTVPSLNQWHHLAITYSEAGASLKGYLDGTLDLTTPINLNLTISTTNHGIGSNAENPAQAFDGLTPSSLDGLPRFG